jgi:flagellar biosynthesis/type III secretory pathway M-ring protein FliF/YscJ
LASRRFTWFFVTASGAGAESPEANYAITNFTAVNLTPIYVLLVIVLVLNILLVVLLIWDHSECLFRRKISDEVVLLKEKPEEEKKEEEEEEEEHEVGFQGEMPLDEFHALMDELIREPPRFQNDELSSDEFAQKMLK